MPARVVRLAAAALAVAAAGVVVPAPARAATCSRASGVSVVVDFHQLGGGAQTFCDASGAGETAAAQFQDAGHTLTYVQGEAFVCEVDGAPDTQCSRTPPADAYWSLWWSNGTSGEWSYASVGVTSLKVPEGGYVALSWQGQASEAKPRVAPVSHSTSTPSSSPTPRPTSSTHPPQGPTRGASSSATGPPSSATSTTGPTPRSSAAPGRTHRRGRHQDATPTTSKHRDHASAIPQAEGPVASVSSRHSGDSGDSGGLPGWVAPVAVVVLFVGAATVALARRRSGDV